MQKSTVAHYSSYWFIFDCFLFVGQQFIQDLWGTTYTTSGWDTSVGSAYDNFCGTEQIIGGEGKFGAGSWCRKTFSGLKGHNSVKVTFVAFYIDSWDGNSCDGGTCASDALYLACDNANQFTRFYEKGSLGAVNICGVSTWEDYFANETTASFPHNLTTITLEWTTSLNQLPNDESFGIKYVQIIVDVICAPECSNCFGNTHTECRSCNTRWFLSGNSCINPCPSNQYGETPDNLCKGNLIL